jgi:prophage tail gpP-like protein
MKILFHHTPQEKQKMILNGNLFLIRMVIPSTLLMEISMVLQKALTFAKEETNKMKEDEKKTLKEESQIQKCEGCFYNTSQLMVIKNNQFGINDSQMLMSMGIPSQSKVLKLNYNELKILNYINKVRM